MNKVIVLIMLLMSISTVQADENLMKKYVVESAKIDYEIKGSGKAMGMLEVKTIGKKRLIFNQFGANELIEENKIEKRIHSGQTDTIKTHKLDYIKGATIYSVDFKKKKIMRMKNPSLAMAGLMGGGKNVAEVGEVMLKKMGGKKIGTDKVAGQSCDVWEVMGAKQCLYKGIPLKIETDVMGIKSIEIATKVEFGAVTKNDFTLPEFEIYGFDIDNPMNQTQKLDKSQLDKMDQQANVQATKESTQMREAFASMAAAANKAGLKKGELPTESQEKEMIAAMQEGMYPRMKQEILKQEKIMQFGKKCFAKAETLKEANKCNQQANEMSGDGEDDFDSWDPKMKKMILGEINRFLKKVIPCIKKAKNVNQMQACDFGE